MYRLLEYTGGFNPWAGKGIEHFVSEIRRRFPNMTDTGLSELAKRMLGEYDPRTHTRTVMLFGRDIMTADVESIPAWDMLAPSAKTRIKEHPHDTGEVPSSGVNEVFKAELLNRLDRRSVNRSVLIEPDDLDQTYVWRKATATPWVQEVTDGDYFRILRHPSLGPKFQDPDVKGAYVEVTSYTHMQVGERHEARTFQEAAAIQRHYRRQPHYSGVDIKE
jgi:hypothetical protein